MKRAACQKNLAFFLAICVLLNSILLHLPFNVYSASHATGWFGAQLGYSGQAIYHQLRLQVVPQERATTINLQQPITVNIGSWTDPTDADQRLNQVTVALRKQLEPVLFAFIQDSPDQFWHKTGNSDASQNSNFSAESDGYIVHGTDGSLTVEISSISFDTIRAVSKPDTKAAQLEAKVRQLIDDLPSATDDYQNLANLHATLLTTIAPANNITAENITAYGALVSGSAQSSGYARAFQLMCAKLPSPIQCITVNNGAKFWNIVQLDGAWYNVDAFTNDMHSQLTCFLAGASSEYIPNSMDGFSLPQVSSTAYGETPSSSNIKPVPDSISYSSAVTYGDSLSPAYLTGEFCTDDTNSTPVEGSFSVTPPSSRPSAGSYSLEYTFTPFDTSLNPYIGSIIIPVAQKELTATSVTAQSRPYDGTTSATATAELSGTLNGDDVTVICAANFADSSPAQDKPVAVSVQLSGSDAANYLLTTTIFTVTADILPLYPDIFADELLAPSIGQLDINRSAMQYIQQSDIDISAGIRSFVFSSTPQVTGDSIFYAPPTISGGDITYHISSGLEVGQKAKVELEITSPDASDLLVLLSVQLEVTGKEQLSISGFNIISTRVFDGTPSAILDPPRFFTQSGREITGVRYKCVYTGSTFSGDNHPDSSKPPVNAGNYELNIQLDDPAYYGASVNSVRFQITRADNYVIAPKPITLSVGSDIPTTFEFDVMDSQGNAVDTPLDFTPNVNVILLGTDSENTGKTVIDIPLPYTTGNFRITRVLDGLITVRMTQPDSTFYAYTARNRGNWHNTPITISINADKKNIYDKLSLTPDGEYSSTATISTEAENGTADIYFRKGSSAITDPLRFFYQLDMTPPAISQIQHKQSLTGTSAEISVQAVDALSGIELFELTGPEPRKTNKNGSFTVTQSGRYTVTVTDYAGNSSAASHDILLRQVNGVVISDSSGNPLGDKLLLSTASIETGARLYPKITGTALPEDYTIQWTSSNSGVASIGQDGALTIHRTGSCIINLTAMGISNSIELTVAAVSPANASPNAAFPTVNMPASSIPAGYSAAGLSLVASQLSDSELAAISDEVAKNSTSFKNMQITAFDLSIVDSASGEKVQPVGPVEIFMPYPAFTAADSLFSLLHLTGGTGELLKVSTTATGISFTVTSLSPFALGYQQRTDSSGNTDNSGIDNNSGSWGSGSNSNSGSYEDDFWDALLDEIIHAKSGKTITAYVGDYTYMPSDIIWELKGRNITLRIVRSSGSNIALNGLELPPLDSSLWWYSMSKLVSMASYVDESSVQTLSSDKSDSNDNGSMPVETSDDWAIIKQTHSGVEIISSEKDAITEYQDDFETDSTDQYFEQPASQTFAPSSQGYQPVEIQMQSTGSASRAAVGFLFSAIAAAAVVFVVRSSREK